MMLSEFSPYLLCSATDAPFPRGRKGGVSNRTVSPEMWKQKQQGFQKKKKHCKELKPDRIILISALYVKQIFT